MSKQIKSTTIKPTFLFETSWEVCNKVGGIHTVISTKARSVSKELDNRYILIGPDLNPRDNNPEFEEDVRLLQAWRRKIYNEGIHVRIGRWKIPGSPIVVLVDFTPFLEHKDDILKFMWDSYGVDSITGEWDYIEPVVFGYAAGKVIESYMKLYCSSADRVVAHFHEWMTASGGLYLQKYSPYTATVFTTHATILGRSLAGNGEPLYSNLVNFNAEEYAHRYNIFAKYSLERAAAKNFDCFATVSDITARESHHLLGEDVDVVTPNGFEDDFVWKEVELDSKRKEARKVMIDVAQACLGYKFEREPLIVGTSGRYEFKNKGLDVLIESLKLVANTKLERDILVYITVPAGNNGARQDLIEHLANSSNPIDQSLYPHTTHHLAGWDPIVEAMKSSILTDPKSRVKVIFVPTYLNGHDGVFNKQYYELLVGMNVTVYASYYEPWGYTPLESIAFGIPTITTSLAGFGVWADTHMSRDDKGVEVINRTDYNDKDVVSYISKAIVRHSSMTEKALVMVRESAFRISKMALWNNFIKYYDKAYSTAISNTATRTKKMAYEGGGSETEQISFLNYQLTSPSPVWTRHMVEKTLPKRLQPLQELSHNLWWSWTTNAHRMFSYAEPEIWREVNFNPIALLDKLSYERVQELEKDQQFLSDMDEVYRMFKEYMNEKSSAKAPKIGYFCMEYGLHHSLKIYSGGLGILAGDYLKEASDKNVPMVAVGLLYRYGYFTQKLSAQGEQEASYETQNFFKLPISPVRTEDGSWVSVQLAFPGRTVTARAWKCEVGRTDLYLLDTDHDLNLDEDRSITHHLYGGDWENRLKQELLLGVGGVRLLNQLDIKQDVYHCNEGHASFMGIERIRDLINSSELSFSEALEVVRSSSLFTTHTPVPAGHDAFSESMISKYMAHYPERLGITWDQFINLGKIDLHDPNEKFSMSFLACNLSQEINGVSWLHGEISKKILGGMWPGYSKDELHISYVTNGVHLPTWVSPRLRDLYGKYFPEGFMNKDYDIKSWQKVHNISDGELWEERMFLKNRLIKHIRNRMNDPQQILFASPHQLIKVVDALKPDVLTIGFARRFATYKRANLLFTNLERLDKIVNNPDMPVHFVFAGKAHPNDKPGQDFIKRIVEISSMAQFAGKVIFLQDYDMNLARRMVQGVDVWLNTPTRSQEASGTSGEKCVMNGVMQFSVLDGWWVEGYKKGAGWKLPMEAAYADNNFQNELDAEIIYATLEDEIAPMYYKRDQHNVPYEWLRTMKNCIADIASNFTTNRMLRDYQERFYNKLHDRSIVMVANDFTRAREIASWKRRVANGWDKLHIVSVSQQEISKGVVMLQENYKLEVVLDINGLEPDDIGVELVVARQIDKPDDIKIEACYQFEFHKSSDGKTHYILNVTPESTGSFDSAIRIYPKNDKLAHRMDFALVKWA